MGKDKIKREIQKLQRTIENQPQVWNFHGRHVVNADQWKYGDWTKLPASYYGLTTKEEGMPDDWHRDYLALMEKLEDPGYGRALCWYCAVYEAQRAKKEIDRQARYWQENGGEAAREEWYKEAGEPHTSSFRKQDAMRQAEWRIYNERGGANNRTCEVINYFRCPYGEEWRRLQQDGYDAYQLWQHISWYDNHWNRNHTFTPSADALKWYHYNDPPIIDVTNYDDIIRATEDGRLDRIVDEHLRYTKETGAKIWNL